MYKKIGKLILAILIIYGAIYFVTPKILNLNSVSKFINNKICQDTNLSINIENPKYKMAFPLVLNVTSEKISIDDALEVNDFSADLEILPLIFNQLYLNKISAKNLNVNLFLDKETSLNLGKTNLKDIKISYRIKKFSSFLSSYNITLSDEMTKISTTLKSNEKSFFEYKNKKHLLLFTKGLISVGNDFSVFNLDIDTNLPFNKIDTKRTKINGEIKHLNLEGFSSYINYFSKEKIISTKGVLDFNASSVNQNSVRTKIKLNNFGLYQKDIAESIYYNGELNIISDINPDGNQLILNAIKFSGDGINVLSKGKIKNFNNKNPNVECDLVIDNSRTEKFITLLPPIKTEDINLYELKKYPFYSDVSGNLHIKGKLNSPSVDGNVLLKNGYLINPIKDTKGAIVKLNFVQRILNLDVNVPIGKSQSVKVLGSIELYNQKNANLDISTTDRVNLEIAETVLNPLHDIFNFIIGPVPVMKIKGIGNANLKITGNKVNPHVFGEFKFFDGTISFNDIKNMVITKGTGILTFDNTNTTFKTLRAYLNGHPISVQGTCNLDGKFDFNIKSNGQNSGDLLKIVKTSPMLKDFSNMLNIIGFSTGLADINLNLYGQVKNPKNMKFLENMFAKGNLILKDNKIKLAKTNAKLSKITGNIDFDNTDIKLCLKGFLNSSKIDISGKTKDNISDIKISSENFSAGDLISFVPNKINIPYFKDIEKIKSSFVAHYKGAIDKIDLNRISLKGKIYSNKSDNPDFLINNADFSLENSNFSVTGFRGNIEKNDFLTELNIKNTFSPKRIVNGTLQFKNFDLSLLNALKPFLETFDFYEIKNINDIKGTVDITAKIKNNRLRAFANLENVSVMYIPQNIRFEILQGNLFLQDRDINVNKLNSKFNGMPVFINGKISNITNKNPFIHLYVNTKPTQDFVDRFINSKAVYPVKIKGDIKFTSNLKGYLNNLNSKSKLSISPESNIYYMGATIGDERDSIEINSDINFINNKIKINEFQYGKSQESKNFIPFLEAGGELLHFGKNISLKNFKIKTLSETNIKIFNILFKKPIMKQGVFTADVILNGDITNPTALGILNLYNLDMPFYNSTINDIKMIMNSDKIRANLSGNILSNNVTFSGIMKNKLTPPFEIEDIKLNLKDLNIDIITDTLRDYEVESTQNKISNSQDLDLSLFIIDSAEITADKIKAKNISATDFAAKCKLDEKLHLIIDKYRFVIAEGDVSGKAKYDLNNHNVEMIMDMHNANAQVMSEALFDLKNQIYGSITGNVNLNCNGKSHDSCMKTLNGFGSFIVADGKMPKLGSLEYLLKAGNLITSGFTNLSINGIIDLITPLKTGDFESISGDFRIKDGIAQNVNIYSNGHELNMYMTGTYNIPNSFADMTIFGTLSNNMSTVFSKIKNVSLNTLFKTIPGINKDEENILIQSEIAKIPSERTSNNIYKIFRAEINGDINGNNYVKTFKWIK